MSEPDYDLYYDLDGQPIGRDQYYELLRQKTASRDGDHDGWSLPGDDPTRIGLERRGDVSVSTVWLGFDLSLGAGPPLVFETMIFGGDHDEEQWRYSTREEALKGHAAACVLAFGGDA